jgi:GNAT superfamily N-acetyltransferase
MEAVRRATTGDAPRLAVLAEELIEATRTHRGGELLIDRDRPGATGDGASGWRARLADPDSLVVVGTLEAVVTGFALAHLEDRGGHGRCGVLDACYVEPPARGIGVGHLLLEAVLSWMGERGCTAVDGAALPGDRQAKNFYESAGFKARLLTMHRPLG